MIAGGIEVVNVGLPLIVEGVDPNNVVDSSFIQELEKSGFIDTVWRK